MKTEKPIRMLGLSLTGQCNYSCRYCYAQDHPSGMMSIETALEAVKLAERSGEPFVIQFTGGEPLLAMETLRAVAEYVRQRNLPAVMQVQSNGSLINDGIACFFKQMKIGVGISLDGRPEINDHQRCFRNGTGTTAQTLAGIGVLAAQGMEIGITCTVTQENAEAMGGIIEMAGYLGNVRRIGFDLLRGQGKGTELSDPLPEAVRKGMIGALEIMDRLSKLTGRSLVISQLQQIRRLADQPDSAFSHCHAVRGEAAFVASDGTLYPCASLVGDKAYRIGHSRQGIDLQRQLEIMDRIEETMKPCRGCKDFSLCGGGCYARWIGSGGGPHPAECAMMQSCIEWYTGNMRRNG